MRDADAVYIPSGYCGQTGPHGAVFSPGWHKVSDGQWDIKTVKRTQFLWYWTC